jgi:L-asparaginase II
MKQAERMVELWRGGMLESYHAGHAVVCDAGGQVVQSWGDPGAVIFPRSSCKMLQALPLLDSGAADAAGLGPEQLALACASHQGAPEHTERVDRWLTQLGLNDDDLRCGPEFPRDAETARAMTCAGGAACQVHNNCSGKHAGFLTLNRHLGCDAEYHLPDHPVQAAVREAFEEATGEASPGYGLDGCSAPNFATTVTGLARAMARFAAASEDGTSVRERSSARLVQAMLAHPSLVAGQGRACTELMQAMGGSAAIKTGAEAVFVAILPQQKLGVALKIVDGTTRASEAAIAAILVKLGVLDPAHPAAVKFGRPPQVNRRGVVVGELRPAEGVF